MRDTSEIASTRFDAFSIFLSEEPFLSGGHALSAAQRNRAVKPCAPSTAPKRCLVLLCTAMDPISAVLARWGDRESTATFCSGFSDWQTRRSVTTRSEEETGAVLAAGTDLGEDDAGAEAPAAATKGPAPPTDGGGNVGDRLSGGVQTSMGAACEPTDESLGMLPRPQPPTDRTPPPASSPLKSFDFILAGDVLYKHCLLEPFLGTVRDMLAPGGRMLLCHVPRAGVTYEIVQQAFVDAGFSFEILNGDGKRREDVEKGSSEENQDAGGGTGVAARGPGGSCCDTTAVGGVELCVDDARRARLYRLHSVA